MPRRWTASTRSALLLYFVLFAVVPMGLVLILNYSNSVKDITKNFVQGRRAVISGVMDTLRSRVSDVEKISDLVYANRAVLGLLDPLKDGRRPPYELIRQSMETFSQLIHYFNSDKYLLSWMIVGENGLDLRYGLSSAYLDFEAVFSSSWYQDGLVSTRPLSWPGLVSGVLAGLSSQVIPVIRPLYDIDLGRRSGTSVILFDPRLFGSAYGQQNDSLSAFTVRGSDDQLLYHGGSEPPLENFEAESRSVAVGGRTFLQTRVVTPEGWSLIESAPMDFLEGQQRALLGSSLVILLSFAVFFLALGIYLSRRLIRPLDRLMDSLAAISRGDFELSIPVEVNDEIGRLATAIRSMKDQIKNLLAEAILHEQNLKRFEIAALQAQINPHFLANTLNAVRIMADMQNAKGISAIVKALGGLLRNTYSRSGDTITVEEELSSLTDYFYILRVRFKGAIHFSVEVDPKLRSCKILRFLLQPLVENAVFHGIEPRETGGKVAVDVTSDQGQLVIRIHDDGVGLSEASLARLMESERIATETDLGRGVRSGFGIFNTNRRLQIAYGSGAGLHYESEEGRFTCVTVRLPLEQCGGEGAC